MNKILHTFVIPAYKESPYLEDCIKSVLNQKYKSNVIICTSTPNKYIENMAKKYNIKVVINKGKRGIGYDFDFAVRCSKTDLVTVAHQDDIYDYNYSYEIVKKYEKDLKISIIFTDYYEIKNNEIDKSNTNLRIKRFLLFPFKFGNGKSKLKKRWCLRFGNAICCPSVCFNKKIVKLPIFACDMKCDIDWYAWEKLSKQQGHFAFCSKLLMGHRVHEESTTTEIIKDNIRTKEDLEIFKKFWPEWIAKIINNFYVKSEKNNEVK